jgi:cephalosporin hydroxylase
MSTRRQGPKRLYDRHVILQMAGRRIETDIYSEEGFKALAELWTRSAWQRRISYGLTWMGIPIIQLPEDILMMHELIYKVKPDVIVETGTAHGGTAVFYASMMELLGKGRVISIDIEIRESNRLAIQAHPMRSRITLVEGSSVHDSTVSRIREMIGPDEKVLVALDSNHSCDHVRGELEKYAPLVTPGSYIVVFDGVMKILADAPDAKPGWVTDNPAAAIRDFLAEHPDFEVDPHYNRLVVTYCPSGFLQRKSFGCSGGLARGC